MWSIKGWIRTLMVALVCYGFVWFFLTSFRKGEAQAQDRGYQQAVGRPMKYADVPTGHWRVIFVVDKSTQTAVIEKDAKAPPYTHEPKYLLVYDMMPQMMEENFTFTKSGSQQKGKFTPHRSWKLLASVSGFHLYFYMKKPSVDVIAGRLEHSGIYFLIRQAHGRR